VRREGGGNGGGGGEREEGEVSSDGDTQMQAALFVRSADGSSPVDEGVMPVPPIKGGRWREGREEGGGRREGGGREKGGRTDDIRSAVGGVTIGSIDESDFDDGPVASRKI
jgi:hypothetical protein